MRTKHLPSVFLAALACLALPACGAKDDKKADKPGEAHEHAKPPHGGELIELGEEEGHLEMMHDHTGGKVTVYVFGSSFDKPLNVEKPIITIMVDKKEVDVPLTALEPKADGTAHGWKGEHEGLKADPWVGRIQVKVAGKDWRKPLEDPDHKH